MNESLHSRFFQPAPASVRRVPDPLLPVRRSFGEGDFDVPPAPRARRRLRLRARPAPAAAPC